MRHDDHGFAGLGQGSGEGQDMVAVGIVEGACWFVGKDHLARFEDEAGNGETLLFSA